MADEALDVLTGLWSGQPFSYHGTHFEVSEISCLPRAGAAAADPDLDRQRRPRRRTRSRTPLTPAIGTG
jgi:alkanesulfonate monooxygenase SsuD/methylene tetrahydromethanopterin reductase-like flavin-dependent oxidoreductase (luciferase family)